MEREVSKLSKKRTKLTGTMIEHLPDGTHIVTHARGRKIGTATEYKFKFTTTPPKGPDPEEVKAVMGEWIDRGSYGTWQDYIPVNQIVADVMSARVTNKALWIRSTWSVVQASPIQQCNERIPEIV